MGKYIDITGQRFGSWTVLEKAPPRPGGKGAYWICECDCGAISEVQGASLRKGDSKSCGCRKGEFVSYARSAKRYPYRRLKIIWRNMIARCENESAISYPLYGARGITVCPEWKSLNAFAIWSLENGYSDNLTIDRIDGSKGYSPDNCRWVSKIEQQNNKCNNHLLTVDGVTDTIANWARKTGLSHSLISSRIDNGWNDERAVKTPRGKYRCRKSA